MFLFVLLLFVFLCYCLFCLQGWLLGIGQLVVVWLFVCLFCVLDLVWLLFMVVTIWLLFVSVICCVLHAWVNRLLVYLVLFDCCLALIVLLGVIILVVSLLQCWCCCFCFVAIQGTWAWFIVIIVFVFVALRWFGLYLAGGYVVWLVVCLFNLSVVVGCLIYVYYLVVCSWFGWLCVNSVGCVLLFGKLVIAVF